MTMAETPAMNVYESTFAQSDRTDAILVVEGKQLHVNKAFLSSHSDYFDTLFNGNFMEKSMKEIEIKDVKYEDFAALLSLIYPKPIAPTEENVEKLRELADRFLLSAAKRHLEFGIICTDPAKSQIDIRELIFYDIFQQKTVENSYKNYEKLCETMGKEAISFDDYENWFITFVDHSKRSSYSNTRHITLEYYFRGALLLPDIPDIRACVLSDFIEEKPVEKSFNNLYNAFKRRNFNKEEHDYWYKRFKNGKLFNRVTFSHLPVDVITKIVGKCDLTSYFNLRKVSHGLRNIVELSKPAIGKISVNCHESIHIKLNNRQSKITLSYLESILKNPKLQLDTLQINLNYCRIKKHNEIIRTLFNSLSHQIHVEHFLIEADDTEDFMTVFKSLKPGVLKKLSLFGHGKKMSIDRLAEMEQWKQLRHVIIDTMSTSLDHFFHFSTFDVWIPSISNEELITLVAVVSTSINFEICKIRFWARFDMGTTKAVLNLQPKPRISFRSPLDEPEVFSIPNTNLLFEILPVCGFQITKI